MFRKELGSDAGDVVSFCEFANFCANYMYLLGIGRPVFQAELQLGYHGAYHTECFKCCSCGKKLDSTTVAEHQGEIFCKGVYLFKKCNDFEFKFA